jgi:hypothetical protein
MYFSLKQSKGNIFHVMAYIPGYKIVQPIYKYQHGAPIYVNIPFFIKFRFLSKGNRLRTIRQYAKGTFISKIFYGFKIYSTKLGCKRVIQI